MPNAFSKEEVVAFEQVLEGFQDQLVMSKLVNIYRPADRTMERTGDVIWRPMPYIVPSYNGIDQSANFNDKTQLSVPTTLGFEKSVPFQMNAKELRDALQEGRLGEAAKQRLASDINVALTNTAALQGTLVVKRTAAASGYDDVAACDAIMNERGVPNYDRHIALSTRDYNGMASDLSKASRSFGNSKSDNAYERSYIGMVAGFDAHKMDYTPRILAAAGGATSVSGNQFYTPRATSTAVTGERNNVDNRYMTLTVDNTAGVVAGDCFTIQGVNAVHHITKQDTGQPMTFRVISVTNGTQMVISPPIISATGGTQAEIQYQNVTAQAENLAPLTWLNTAAGFMNPFWQRDSIELVAGRYTIPTGAGVEVMYGTTDQGITMSMTKWVIGENYSTRYRFDTFFGTVNLNPEQNGIILFSQP
jgi:hypothetical protein